VYASPEIERLNAFVTDGGRLEDYYNTVKPGGIDPEVLDTTSDADLKVAIKEKLLLQGYKDDRIKKMISRYEDSDILQDEGEDAVEFLKDYKISEKERLLENTRKQAEQVKNQQQKFYSSVESNIKDLESIRGIKVSGRDKQDLLDYIFKPDSTGVTKYQRDYMSDVKNLIESAYFTKQGDKLINTAKQVGTSDAYKDLHQKLKANKGKRSSGAASQDDSDSSESLTNLLGKHLLRK
jgi:stalled ribosome rescue protein Dom34